MITFVRALLFILRVLQSKKLAKLFIVLLGIFIIILFYLDTREW